jgi:hypothetical protein
MELKMFSKLLATTALIVTGATSASAWEFTGGSLGLEYESYQDSSELDTARVSSELEFSITPSFSIGAELSRSEYLDADFGPFDLSTSNYALHAIYSINNSIKVGAFVGGESFFYIDAETYGIEASFESGSFNVASYLGGGDFVGEDITLVGLSASYGFNDQFSVTGDVDYTEFRDFDFSSTESKIGINYNFGNGAEIFANVGQTSFENFGSSISETFVSMGTTISFGPQGGTSFEAPRSLSFFNLLGLILG